MENNFRNVIDPTAKIYHKTLTSQHGLKRRGSHFYYYIARNRFFLGAKHAKGFQKISFVSDYLAETIRLINNFSHQADSDHAIDAYLTGVSDAFLNKSGQWNGIVRAPGWLKKLYGLLCSWHPFFWMDLFRGEFAKISSEMLRRIKTKLTRTAG